MVGGEDLFGTVKTHDSDTDAGSEHLRNKIYEQQHQLVEDDSETSESEDADRHARARGSRALPRRRPTSGQPNSPSPRGTPDTVAVTNAPPLLI